MSQSTALYVYWDSHSQFKSKLYPIAEAAYRQFGTRAIIITVCSRTFYQEIQPESWLTVHHYDPLVLKDKIMEEHRSILRNIISYLRRHFDGKKYWKEQSKKIMDLYKPDAAFLWGGCSSREFPWLLKLIDKTKAPSIFVGENHIVFGYKQVMKMRRRDVHACLLESTLLSKLPLLLHKKSGRKVI